MLKHEIKVEFSNSEILKSIIEKSYFEEGNMGKISGNKNFITLTKEIDEEAYDVLKGLNNATVKISNQEIIDGTIRFIIDENDNTLKMFPISIYCIKEEDKYSF